uniref:hypothetical protein n=1 Tax=Bacillus nitratireducens TaxID=2026193 RepID=UPI001C92BE84
PVYVMSPVSVPVPLSLPIAAIKMLTTPSRRKEKRPITSSAKMILFFKQDLINTVFYPKRETL